MKLMTTPPGVRLGPLDIIRDGAARNFVLEVGDGRFHGFVVRRGESVQGFVDLCPHMSLPLAQKLDDYLTPAADFISCSWHGALFKIEDGVCVAGPCTGSRLRPWPVEVRDGSLLTC